MEYVRFLDYFLFSCAFSLISYMYSIVVVSFVQCVV